MKNPVVHILLATYNGERFLRQQLDSLFNQTYTDFFLLVRDDGSTDNTLQIITEYQTAFPGKINILKDENKNVGAAQNFGILLSHSNADYIFLCDQDDIWMENKIEISLNKIFALENNENNIPCVVFSDMKLINENGTLISESLWNELHLHPDYFTLNRLLIQNIPHGCTMVINRSMRDIALPVPSEAILHDHWIALLAASCGKWDHILSQTVLLRNHAQNVTRKQTTISDKLKRFATNFFSKKEYEYFIKIRVSQARALQDRTSNCIEKKNAGTLKNFIRLESTQGFSRKRILLTNKFFRTSLLHTIKMILRA
ncbi:MAG: putative glycosyltransferase [Bacteroidota bacterium]|nr:putative glycosyltransferase [Bacteroidota bacterium]